VDIQSEVKRVMCLSNVVASQVYLRLSLPWLMIIALADGIMLRVAPTEARQGGSF